jgi:hypothetical protein
MFCIHCFISFKVEVMRPQGNLVGSWFIFEPNWLKTHTRCTWQEETLYCNREDQWKVLPLYYCRNLDILVMLFSLNFLIFIPAMVSAKTAQYTTPTLFSPVMFKNWVALLVGVMDRGRWGCSVALTYGSFRAQKWFGGSEPLQRIADSRWSIFIPCQSLCSNSGSAISCLIQLLHLVHCISKH